MFHWARAGVGRLEPEDAGLSDRRPGPGGHAAGSWYFEPKAKDSVGRISWPPAAGSTATSMAT